MPTTTPTIDCQVHAYERNMPEQPWRSLLTGPREVTGDDMVQAMDAVDVDGALLISPFAFMGTIHSVEVQVNPGNDERTIMSPEEASERS